MAKWRIKRGDKIAGDVSSGKVRQLAAAGKLNKTDLLCKEGTEKWVLAGNVKGLWETKSSSQSEEVSAKDQKKPQTAAPSSPASADSAAQTSPVEAKGSEIREEALPQPEATEALPKQKPTETLPVQEASEAPPVQEATEALPLQEVTETLPAQEATEALPAQEATEALPLHEATETLPPQEAFTSNQETIEESPDPGIQTLAERDVEHSEESRPMSDDAPKIPRRKWLVPLVAGVLGSLLLMGLVSTFMNGPKPEVSQQQPVVMPEQQSDAGQQRPTRVRSSGNHSLTSDFFSPNPERNVEYTTKKFVNNTTVTDYQKTTVERWDTDTELFYHEKHFRNYGLKLPYRVSNGYIQLKGNKNWFRFLKLDAKIGDKWTPGDGEDGTLDWAEKGKSGEIELVDFEMIDSVPVAILEFRAELGHPVPSYLVPAAFDFGFMEDGSGPIEGKLRFELGQGLGVLRIDAIVPQGKRHKSGGGTDTKDWTFATRLRNSATQNGDEAKAASD